MAIYASQNSLNNDMIDDFLRTPYQLSGLTWTIRRFFNAFYDFFKKFQYNEEDLAKMSKEEIYDLIPKISMPSGGAPKCPACGSKQIRIKKFSVKYGEAKFKCDSCGHEWTSQVQFEKGSGGQGIEIPIDEIEDGLTHDLKGDDNLEGKVLQEGDPEIYNQENSEDDLEQKWRDRVIRAYSTQKLAGTVPAGLKRVIDRMLHSKVSWETILRQAIMTGLGKTVVSSYRRASRKHPALPGIIRYTIPKVFFLPDMSGSMSDTEITQAMTELYSIARKCEFTVICWDSSAYETIEGRTQQDVIEKVISHIRGGGGTEVAPVLRRVINLMRSKDIVVIFSDFYIYDWDNEETQQLLSDVASKASVAVLVSTGQRPDPMPQGWVYVKVEINNEN